MTLPPSPTGFQRWHVATEEALRTGEVPDLSGLVAPDAVFCSPAVFAPQPGRDLVVAYLTAAMRVLGPGGFHYERVWRRDGADEAAEAAEAVSGGSEGPEPGAVLEFRTSLGGREVHGVDIIEWDADGLIRDFTVLIRPQSALTMVIEHMAAELQRMLGLSEPG